MSKVEQQKIPVSLTDVLVRKDDGLKKSGIIKYVEFDERGRGKAFHDSPKEGFACIVDPQRGQYFTWMTSPIVEVISEKEFKTQNSHYIIE